MLKLRNTLADQFGFNIDADICHIKTDFWKERYPVINNKEFWISFLKGEYTNLKAKVMVYKMEDKNAIMEKIEVMKTIVNEHHFPFFIPIYYYSACNTNDVHGFVVITKDMNLVKQTRDYRSQMLLSRINSILKANMYELVDPNKVKWVKRTYSDEYIPIIKLGDIQPWLPRKPEKIVSAVDLNISNVGQLLNEIYFSNLVYANIQLYLFMCKYINRGDSFVDLDNVMCSSFGTQISKSLIKNAVTRIFADPVQSVMEIISNAIDAYEIPGLASIGKFGMGFMSIMNLILQSNDKDSFIEVSSYKSGNPNGFHLKIFKNLSGELAFNLILLKPYTGKNGTSVTVKTSLSIMDTADISNYVYNFVHLPSVQIRRSDRGAINEKSSINSPYYIDIKYDDGFIQVTDYGKGIDTNALAALLIPALSTKTLTPQSTNFVFNSLTDFRKYLPDEDIGVQNFKILVNNVIIWKKYISSSSQSNPLILLDLPPNVPLTVARDDIIINNDNIRKLIYNEIDKLIFQGIENQNLIFLESCLKAYEAHTTQAVDFSKYLNDRINNLPSNIFLAYEVHHEPLVRLYQELTGRDDLKLVVWHRMDIEKLENLFIGLAREKGVIDETSIYSKAVIYSSTVKTVENLGLSLVLVVNNNPEYRKNFMLMYNDEFLSNFMITDKFVPDITKAVILNFSKPINFENFDEIVWAMRLMHNNFDESDIDKEDYYGNDRVAFKYTKFFEILFPYIGNRSKILNIFYKINSFYRGAAFILTRFYVKCIELLSLKEAERYLSLVLSKLMIREEMKHAAAYGKKNFSSRIDKTATGIISEKNITKLKMRFVYNYIMESLTNLYSNEKFLEIPNYLPVVKMIARLPDEIIHNLLKYDIYISFFIVKKHPYVIDKIGRESVMLDHLVKLIRKEIPFEYLKREFIPRTFGTTTSSKHYKSMVVELVKKYDFYINLKGNITEYQRFVVPSSAFVFSLAALIKQIFKTDNSLFTFDDIISGNWVKNVKNDGPNLQIIEIASSFGSSKQIYESVLIELVQNSIDAIRLSKIIDRRIDITVDIIKISVTDYTISLSVRDNVGIKKKNFIYLIVPYLSSKVASQNVTGEMGNGFFNVYREGQEIRVTTVRDNTQIAMLDVPKIRNETGTVYDLTKGLIVTQSDDPNYTKVEVLFRNHGPQVEKIREYVEIEEFVKSVIATLTLHHIDLTFNGEEILLNTKELFKHKEGITVYQMTERYPSLILLKGVPFRNLVEYLQLIMKAQPKKSLKSDKRFDIINGPIMEHLKFNLLINFDDTVYTPVQSRTSITFTSPKKVDALIKCLECAIYTNIIDQIEKSPNRSDITLFLENYESGYWDQVLPSIFGMNPHPGDKQFFMKFEMMDLSSINFRINDLYNQLHPQEKSRSYIKINEQNYDNNFIVNQTYINFINERINTYVDGWTKTKSEHEKWEQKEIEEIQEKIKKENIQPRVLEDKYVKVMKDYCDIYLEMLSQLDPSQLNPLNKFSNGPFILDKFYVKDELDVFAKAYYQRLLIINTITVNYRYVDIPLLQKIVMIRETNISQSWSMREKRKFLDELNSNDLFSDLLPHELEHLRRMNEHKGESAHGDERTSLPSKNNTLKTPEIVDLPYGQMVYRIFSNVNLHNRLFLKYLGWSFE